MTVTKVPAVGYTSANFDRTVNIQPRPEHLYTAMWDSGSGLSPTGRSSLTPGGTLAKITVMVPHSPLLIVQNRSQSFRLTARC